ncbi:unnamed protein product, partial [Musa textilis]
RITNRWNQFSYRRCLLLSLTEGSRSCTRLTLMHLMLNLQEQPNCLQTFDPRPR